MSSEDIVNALVTKFNELGNRRKFYLKYVEKEAYLLIEFGATDEKCFIFKKYLKPHHEVAVEKEKLYTNLIEGILERMYDLINRDKFV
jgi:hypothetical protein